MAGANKPDGKSNTQRVAFTRRDADRIARVVRTVEAGDKDANALTFGHRQQPGQGGGSLRLAIYTATISWNACNVSAATSSTSFAGATMLVQFVRGATSTATAVNFTASLARKTTVTTAANRSITLASIDSLWVLVGAQC
jgi:hypothetical protein